MSEIDLSAEAPMNRVFALPLAAVKGNLGSYNVDDATGFPVLCVVEPRRAAAFARAVNSYDAMLAALKGLTAHYAELANSGDCGFWNPEEEPEVEAARAAIRLAEGKEIAP